MQKIRVKVVVGKGDSPSVFFFHMEPHEVGTCRPFSGGIPLRGEPEGDYQGTTKDRLIVADVVYFQSHQDLYESGLGGEAFLDLAVADPGQFV